MFVELGELTALGSAKGALLRAHADALEWFARELARLPFGLRIVEPAVPRRALTALLYGGGQARDQASGR